VRVDRIQIIVVTASDERKATMERQFAELDIPYPVHYLAGKTYSFGKVDVWYRFEICGLKLLQIS
jgi:hypothetical protein